MAVAAEKRVLVGGSKENLSPVVPAIATSSNNDIAAAVNATKSRRGSSSTRSPTSYPL